MRVFGSGEHSVACETRRGDFANHDLSEQVSKMRVLVDPGHGGRDSGAVSADGALAEKDVVLAIGRRVAQLLTPHGVVELSRETDYFLKLRERASKANFISADLLSIHANAGGGRGFEVFTSPGQTTSDRWASAVLNALHCEFPDRPVRSDFSDGDPDKEARFTVLTATKRPAILVEVGFIDTEEGAAFLADAANHERLAKAIAAGTLRVNGIEPEGVGSSSVKPPVARSLEERVAALEALHPELS